MRPKTKLPIPNPTGNTEFQNFDRLMRIVVPAERKTEKEQCSKKRKKG